MGDEGRLDEAVGRAKEAVGALTDDEKMRREGRTDQAAGKVKRKLGELVDRAKEEVEDLLDGDDEETSSRSDAD
jgi:uncharacterized protein YjbJ (UPF0337 family)